MPDFTSSSGVSEWSGMAAWLAASVEDKPVAFILELGPKAFMEGRDAADPVCAQIQVLANGVFMLRRSRTILGHLMLADYASDGLDLDLWHNDGHFDDCTDGYIFSRDAHLIADIAVAWFRDNWATAATDELGCDYRFPDQLRPPAAEPGDQEPDGVDD